MAGPSSLRVGVVGAGWIAQDHLANLAKLGAQVAGVCDTDPERARAAADGAGTTAYADWHELVERERPDALVVCVPPLVHREVALPALEQGLHVYLEKPIARTLDDAEAIVTAAEASSAVCAVGYQWHALELLDDVRAALDDQEIALLAGRSFGPTQSRPWFLDRRQGGGNVLERASHNIDLMRAIAGEVAAVQASGSGVALAQGEGERGDIEDAASLTLHFARGGIGTILVAWTRAGMPGTYALDVLASEASLALALDPAFELRGVSRGATVQAKATQHPLERSLARFLEAAAAGDRSRVFCRPADAAKTLAVALACEEALATGETVAVA
jgi:predicted dehydrogenase